MVGDLLRTPLAEINTTLRRLSNYGVIRGHLKLLRSDEATAWYTARAIRRAATAHLEGAARERLGESRLFGVDDWYESIGGRLTSEQLTRISQFPWGIDVLREECPFTPGREVWETHVAFLGVPRLSGKPLTLACWQRHKPQWLAVHDDGPVQRTQCRFQWYLVPLRPVSSNHLPTEYRVASVMEEVTKLLLFRWKKGGTCIWPLESWTAQCREETTGTSFCIKVLPQKEHWLIVEQYDESTAAGLAVSRKLP